METINKYKSQIIFAVIAAIAVGVLVFYIVPQIQSIQEKIVQIGGESKKNETLSKKIDFLNQLEATDIEEKYQLVNQALLKDKNPYKIFGVIDNVLSKIDAKDLTLGAIQFAPGEMKSGKIKKSDANLMFDIPVKGKYDTFLELVKQFETGYPLVSVSGVSGKISDASSELKVNFTIYVLPEPEYIASLQTPLVDFTREEISFLDKIRSLAPLTPEIPFTPQKFNNKNLF